MTASLQLPLVYEEVRDALRQRVEQSWKAGERLPPIAELARQLGTGQVNTGRAVRALVGEGLLVSRPRRGTFVSPARPTHSTTSNTQSVDGVLTGKAVALVRSSSVEPFMDVAFAAAGDALRTAGAMVSETRFRTGRINALLGTLADVNAMILFNSPSNELLQINPRQAVVLVRTGSDLPVAARAGADMVTIDSEHGGYLAGALMKQCGMRDVCFIGRHKPTDTTSYDLTSTLRLSGLEQGLGGEVEHGRQLKTAWYNPDAGGLAMASYLQLQPRPQGVFCASDDIAVGFACAGLSHGLIPGRDYYLIGFDGQIRGRELLHGPLTTVELPVDAMGRAAVKLLSQRLVNPHEPARRVSLCGTLRLGATTPAPHAFESEPVNDPPTEHGNRE